MRWSLSGAKRSMPASPDTAVAIGTPSGGRSQTRAVSTSKNSPRCVTRPPSWSLRITSMASASMSWRMSAPGQPSPVGVLVEPLATAETEREAAVGEQLQGRGLLGHHGRVVAHRRAGHVGHQLDALGGLGHGTEQGPGVRRVALALEPRRVVVAAHQQVEAHLLGRLRIAHQLLRSRLLGHQRVSESGHVPTVGRPPHDPAPPKG